MVQSVFIWKSIVQNIVPIFHLIKSESKYACGWINYSNNNCCMSVREHNCHHCDRFSVHNIVRTYETNLAACSFGRFDIDIFSSAVHYVVGIIMKFNYECDNCMFVTVYSIGVVDLSIVFVAYIAPLRQVQLNGLQFKLIIVSSYFRLKLSAGFSLIKCVGSCIYWRLITSD